MPTFFRSLAILTLALGVSSSAWATTITFSNDDWTPTVDGPIVAGSTVIVDFDFSRFSRCTAAGRMYQSLWQMLFRFDGGEVSSWTRTQPDRIWTIDVPANARKLELWFRNFTLSSPDYPPVCEAYDSKYGANYTFEIVP